MKTDEIVEFFDDFLEIEDFQDNELNGLQIGGADEIKKLGVAVKASLPVIKEVAEKDIDMLFVHHGLLFTKPEPITGNLYSAVKLLMENDCNLYACHLPLDAHPEIGNNIKLSQIVNLENISPFGFYKGGPIGFKGEFEEPREFEDILNTLSEKLVSSKIEVIEADDSELIKTAAAISGSGAFALAEAIEYDIDLLITGEPSPSVYHPAREGGVSIIFAGDYATEVLGVIAIGEHINEKFGVEWEFIHIPH
jgi:dinuclear metal center YbgI/SA1388 family protein